MGMGFPNIECKPLSREDAAYIAGFFDGEGHFCILKRKDRTRLTVLRMGIAQNNLEVLFWIKEVTGLGQVHVRVKGGKTHDWYLNGHSIKSLTLQLFPFLKVKKDQAILAMEFCDTIVRSRTGSKGLPDNVSFIREGMKDKMCELNHTITNKGAF